MNKIKKISINEFENIVKENFNEYITVEWRGLSVIIKPILSLSEMLAFVNSVTLACFNEDDLSFCPEAEDFAIRTAIIELYTNIRLPSNINKRYDLLYNSDIVDFICDNVNQSQFDAIIHAARKKISHNSDANIAATNKQIASLYAMFENIQTQMANIFDNVGSEDIKNIITAIGDGKIDEEKLVKAYIDNK